jgi:hypothetical protein
VSRRTVRDRWAAAVLASDLNNATKVVMWALYRHMDEHGRVRHRRDDLADECGLANARRVSDRIKEARDKGFLTARAGGVNGQVVQYYAELPGSQRQGPSSRGRGGGLEGPSDRDPQAAAQQGRGSQRQGPIRARVTQVNHNNGATPAAQHGATQPVAESTASSWDEWQSTPRKRPSSNSTGRVA